MSKTNPVLSRAIRNGRRFMYLSLSLWLCRRVGGNRFRRVFSWTVKTPKESSFTCRRGRGSHARTDNNSVVYTVRHDGYVTLLYVYGTGKSYSTDVETRTNENARTRPFTVLVIVRRGFILRSESPCVWWNAPPTRRRRKRARARRHDRSLDGSVLSVFLLPSSSAGSLPRWRRSSSSAILRRLEFPCGPSTCPLVIDRKRWRNTVETKVLKNIFGPSYNVREMKKSRTTEVLYDNWPNIMSYIRSNCAVGHVMKGVSVNQTNRKRPIRRTQDPMGGRYSPRHRKYKRKLDFWRGIRRREMERFCDGTSGSRWIDKPRKTTFLSHIPSFSSSGFTVAHAPAGLTKTTVLSPFFSTISPVRPPECLTPW